MSQVYVPLCKAKVSETHPPKWHTRSIRHPPAPWLILKLAYFFHQITLSWLCRDSFWRGLRLYRTAFSSTVVLFYIRYSCPCYVVDGLYNMSVQLKLTSHIKGISYTWWHFMKESPFVDLVAKKPTLLTRHRKVGALKTYTKYILKFARNP